MAAAPAAPVRRPLVVVGTDTDVGKTVASALLVRAAARCGPVTYWKPVQTGDDSDTDTVRALAGGTAARFLAPEHGYPLPASPHEAAADAGATIDVDALEATFAAHARATDGALLVELAGGLLVPYDDTRTQADSLARLRPRLVLVARSGLGTLNHTLLTLEALRARRLEPEALLLVGDEHPSNRETLRRMGGVAHVYEVPRFAPLDAAALDAWLDEHDLAGLFDA
ncbi:MAG: dethiobiotin synthase [Planctomycetes bacterium]|nr:dethiobiotin synthase [Planctomycetota bacterium]